MGFLTNTGLGALNTTSTIGAFVGGAARGIDEQILGKQEQDAKLEQIKQAKANQNIKEWKAEQKQLMKDGAAQDYLTGIGLKGDDLRRAMSAYHGGIPLTDIANGIQRNSQSSNNSVVGSVTGNPSIGAGGSTDLDGVTDPLMAAAIVKQHESNGDYFIGYDGGKGVNLKDYPSMPGYYGFPKFPGANNSHAAGAHGFEPETYRHYAAIVSKTLGRDVDWHNPSDQDAVFDAAWKDKGPALWAPYWNKNLPRPQVAAQAQQNSGTPQASPVPTNQQASQQQIPDTNEAQSFAEGGEADNPNMGAYIMSGGGQQAGQDQQPMMQSAPSSPQQNQAIQNPVSNIPSNPQQNQSIQSPSQPLAQASQAPTMSDAGNDLRNPAIQGSMPGGTQTADATFMYPSRSPGNGNNPQTMDQLHQMQIENLKNQIQNRKQEQMNRLYQRELEERKNNLELLKTETPDQKRAGELANAVDEDFLKNPKYGLEYLYNQRNQLQDVARDADNIVTAFGSGVKANRVQDALDNLQRLVSPFGVDLSSIGLGANQVTDINTLRKNIGNLTFSQISQYHLGRWTNYEVGLLQSKLPSLGADPSTDIKIALSLRDGATRQISSVTKAYDAVYGPNGNQYNVAAGRKTLRDADRAYDIQSSKPPWQQVKDNDFSAVSAIPNGQWFENLGDHQMYIKDSSGNIVRAGDKVQ